ncbi:MAG: tRNA uridine-5-carboxymethylaminomethyl(34) synthesis GTPase MnmE [Clostridia bacterium]|nr:tRNA uridine-5-carboxymethylaminomethyl(34) synthesis GTPase MnmE [Clostridia bacterium]
MKEKTAGSLPVQGETVAAVSTPHGTGGIAVIRISGEKALETAKRIFLPASGDDVSALEANRAVYGSILCENEAIDDGILTVFRAPRSFTGEDVAEISCHGGVLLTAKVLEAALLAGARQARPGEFSERAFLNGKISLSQAEATVDLIGAENEHQLRLASKNAQGALTRRVDGICEELTALLAQVYVTIDYPDEDLSDMTAGEMRERLSLAINKTEKLLYTYKTGAAVAHGIPTVIVGRPNVGKSSLLNMLLGRQRAIVTEYEGTTRDTVEETATLGKITLNLCDTAGLRRTDDPVEKLGVERSYEKLAEAELVFAVFDGAEEARDEDRALIGMLKEARKPTVAIINKSDKKQVFDLRLTAAFPTVVLSTAEKEPPEELAAAVEKLTAEGGLSSLDEGLITNARQAAAAENALCALKRARAALDAHALPDVAALDVEEALSALRALDGRAVGEEIVGAIFSRFCVGK